jgi:hypothetical protein
MLWRWWTFPISNVHLLCNILGCWLRVGFALYFEDFNVKMSLKESSFLLESFAKSCKVFRGNVIVNVLIIECPSQGEEIVD